MHADELCSAVKRIVDILNTADILSAVRQYRAATGADRSVAAARLGHAGAVIMEHTANLSGAERAVVQCMHLESLSSSSYWNGLLQAASEPRQTAAELVHLYSRVMFATSHLPNLMALLESGGRSEGDTGRAAAAAAAPTLQPGQQRLSVRLTDAGERASDPDRIARTVDGIDMLYSACASVARKPAMDLRLDAIDGLAERNIHFTGESDSVAAVSEVIRSIPEALSQYDDSDDIDLDRLIASLPVFDVLNQLAETGGFGGNDLRDISETMHQGILLLLESGVILVQAMSSTSATEVTASLATSKSVAARAAAAMAATLSSSDSAQTASAQRFADAAPGGAAGSGDEHYQRYLAEREALLSGENAPPVSASDDDQRRREAVDALLKSLGQARSA